MFTLNPSEEMVVGVTLRVIYYSLEGSSVPLLFIIHFGRMSVLSACYIFSINWAKMDNVVKSQSTIYNYRNRVSILWDISARLQSEDTLVVR